MMSIFLEAVLKLFNLPTNLIKLFKIYLINLKSLIKLLRLVSRQAVTKP